eukprot:6129847-Pyramimonas_sp.AAC.1
MEGGALAVIDSRDAQSGNAASGKTTLRGAQQRPTTPMTSPAASGIKHRIDDNGPKASDASTPKVKAKEGGRQRI